MVVGYLADNQCPGTLNWILLLPSSLDIRQHKKGEVLIRENGPSATQLPSTSMTHGPWQYYRSRFLIRRIWTEEATCFEVLHIADSKIHAREPGFTSKLSATASKQHFLRTFFRCGFGHFENIFMPFVSLAAGHRTQIASNALFQDPATLGDDANAGRVQAKPSTYRSSNSAPRACTPNSGFQTGRTLALQRLQQLRLPATLVLA